MSPNNVVIWHVHGSWLEAFVQGAHAYWLPVTPGNARGRRRAHWPATVREADPAELRELDIDAIVFQRTSELDEAQQWLGSRRLGRDVAAIYVEHNAPQGRINEMRHPLADREDLEIVHVTHFNALFWDAGTTRARVIEHGIPDPGYRYTGELERCAVVINEAARRGRVTGTDLLPWLASVAPYELFGIGTPRDLPMDALHAAMGRHRVYVHPFRWTSLGLALLEAMAVGMPVVALATTEVPAAVPAQTGVVSNDPRVLADAIVSLMRDPERARTMGNRARAHVLHRYGLPRFLAAWDALLAESVARLGERHGRVLCGEKRSTPHARHDGRCQSVSASEDGRRRQTIMTLDPLAYRGRFSGLEGSAWLVSHSMGAPPAAARDALVAYHDTWAQYGPEGAWPRWLELVCRIGDTIGTLIGAPAGTISLAPNVSVLQAALASSLDFRGAGAKNEVVYEALQFPSLTYVWTAWQRTGAVVKEVPSDDGKTIPAERICAAITERTAVVVLSHAYYQSAVLIDVPAIVARAREVGALVVLDAYQTTGIVPYDVRELDLDVVVGGSHKWLCGGPGCGWIYVRPELRERFEPMVTGWFAHREPFAFERAPIAYTDDQFRWATGTPPIPGYLAAMAGHALIAEAGVAAIRAHNSRLTTRLTEAARERGWPVSTPLDPAARTGWVGLDLPRGRELVEALARQRIYVDYRPGCGLRVSAHLYTTVDDVDRFVEAVAALSAGPATVDEDGLAGNIR